MSLRALTAITLLLAACTADGGSGAAPAADPPTATPATDPAPPPRQLEYGYEPGSTLAYDVMVSQDIAFAADGDAAGFGDGELPIDADLVTESTGTSTYTVDESGKNGAVVLAIAAEFPDTRVAGTVNGTPVDSLEEGGIGPELARIETVDVRLTLDRMGRVLDGDDADQSAMGPSLAALTRLTDDLFSQPVGPVFPTDRAVTVGDMWEITSERVGSAGPITARSTSEVEDVVDGVYVIRTTTVTDGYEVDFSAEFRDLFLVFTGLSDEDAIPPEIQQQLDSIEFSISVLESTSTEVAEFDPETGTIRASTRTAGTQLSMVFRSPGQDGEDSTGFDIDLDMTQTAVFTRAR